jgi:hypothetical protein
MRDFRAYVRQNLPPLEVSGAREAEIVEELALEFQESYERALRRGLNPEQAWQDVRNKERPWRELGDELQLALGKHDLEPPEPAKTGNIFRQFSEDLTRDLRYAARRLLKPQASLWSRC